MNWLDPLSCRCNYGQVPWSRYVEFRSGGLPYERCIESQHHTEEGNMAEWEVNFKEVSVKMSDGTMFAGKVNIRNFSRLSDFLRTATDPFIVIVSGVEPNSKVLMVNKNYIVWAEVGVPPFEPS
jgi:hypothetical protein